MTQRWCILLRRQYCSLMKYADDTYLVIPACNVDSRDKEIANIDAWARVNNLTLNA